jgi:hypothetical protein
VSLVAPDEVPLLRDIEKLLTRTLATTEPPAFAITVPQAQPTSHAPPPARNVARPRFNRRNAPRGARAFAGR